MEHIGKLLKQPREKLPKPPKYKWQELALTIIKEMMVDPKRKSSVFKVCKDNEDLARWAYNTCKELRKWDIRYFFKLMSSSI